MKLGLYLRNMGPRATRSVLLECARRAEEAGIRGLWVADHLAIPPDESEGSDGYYLDPLATLAFLAAATQRIELGTGVLVAPYRPALPTAKWVATIQELSQGRLRLGVGPGWMEAEFRALGVPKRSRGRVTDETLAFLHRCFADDQVEMNGQRFLFRPRPERPPIYVGGSGPHALERVLRFGDGWMPVVKDPETLRGPIAELNARAGRKLEVIALTTLPLDDGPAVAERLQQLGEAGATAVVHAQRYGSADEFGRMAERLREAGEP